MTRDEIMKCADNFSSDCVPVRDLGTARYYIKLFIDYVRQYEDTSKVDINDNSIKSQSDTPKMFEPFFFEYFLYHGYLTKGEEQTIRGAMLSFFEKYNTEFYSLSSYELQKKVNEFWQESSYSREVYKALGAFVVYWKTKLAEIDNSLRCIDHLKSVLPSSTPVWDTSNPYIMPFPSTCFSGEEKK